MSPWQIQSRAGSPWDPVLPRAPHCHARSQHRRLCFFGTVQFLGGTVLREFPKVVAQYFGRFGETLADHRRRLCEIREHADGLRTLAGKDEGE